MPPGWVIVCAGNPAVYIRTARPLDTVTLDRVRRVDVEPDYPTWRTWAAAHDAHPAVLSFLDLRPENFCLLETRGRERDLVTPRAWFDLSLAMKSYERHNLPVDVDLISQYVQVPTVAQSFATYVALFADYARDYRIADILEGRANAELAKQARAASFDERAALCGLLVDALKERARDTLVERDALAHLRRALAAAKEDDIVAPSALLAQLNDVADATDAEIERNAARYRNDPDARRAVHLATAVLRETALAAYHAGNAAHSEATAAYTERHVAHRAHAVEAVACVDAAIRFVAEAFGEGNELIMCLTEITAHPALADLVSTYDAEEYFAHLDALMLDERAQAIAERLARIQQA